MSSFLALSLAATLAAAPPTLTLEDALNRARQENLDLKAAQARLAQADTASRKAWSNYLPQVSVSGAIIRNSIEAVIPAGPLAPVEIVIQPRVQIQAQGQVRQALIAPQLWAGIQAAYQAERVAALNVEQARREIFFGVAQAFYGTAAQAQAVTVQERLVELNTARAKDTKVRFDAGTVTRVALLRAEQDLARAEQDLIRARNAEASAKLVLSTLLALDDPNFNVAMPPEPQVPEKTDTDVLVERSLEQRADVAAARERVELSQTNKRGVWFSYLPNVQLSGTYNINNAAGLVGSNRIWLITLGASWTLWDGGLREANLAEASAVIAENRALQRKAELTARQEVNTAQLDLESALANRFKAAQAVELARESQRLTEAAFRADVATYLEVADANTALTQAEIGLVAERLQASLAALKLMRAVGAFGARPLTSDLMVEQSAAPFLQPLPAQTQPTQPAQPGPQDAPRQQ
ncbi:Heavy metal RND efflux outer membrane protein, CzcC family [Myxococcus hansupus]|uniref:Heavy metal RND efflux outer membrane protein, CzcC family n=1 Tax=Pseudomyxococcus hansupus TaxID=1297742 RepID=A0A0H4WPM2_9BACT|nr:TolC family protein [Myxococcus hansupus]AKQ63488.1 Heavy metal RND efflux outer membrane protein, CzcC family [Myxococcus hansupus]